MMSASSVFPDWSLIPEQAITSALWQWSTWFLVCTCMRNQPSDMQINWRHRYQSKSVDTTTTSADCKVSLERPWPNMCNNEVSFEQLYSLSTALQAWWYVFCHLVGISMLKVTVKACAVSRIQARMRSIRIWNGKTTVNPGENAGAQIVESTRLPPPQAKGGIR